MPPRNADPSSRNRGESADRRTRRSPSSRLIAIVWVVGILGGTALGVWLLGRVAPIDSDPEQAPLLGGVVGFFAGLIAAAGVLGGMTMAGMWGILPGVGVGVAMFGLVAASFAPGPWLIVGLAGFVVAIVGFFAAGLASGYAPPGVVSTFGSPLSAVVGAVLLVLGIVGGSSIEIVLGVGFVATALTVFGFRLARRRRDGRSDPAG